MELQTHSNMSDKAARLGRRLSQTDTDTAVDFEISFAALLATASLTYPLPEIPLASQATAFAVLIVTISRRMALLSEFIQDEDDDARREWFMSWTVPLLEFASVSAVLLLFYVLYSKWISGNVDLAVFWFSVAIGVVLLAVIQELLFRDEIIWWFHKLNKKFQASSGYAASLWGYLAWQTWNWSRAPIADHGSGRFRYGPSDDRDYTFTDALRFFVKGLGLYLVVNGVILYIGFKLFGIAGLFFVFAIGLIRDQIRFWYSAYGNSTFEQMTGPWYRTYLVLIVYLLVFSSLL